MIIALVGAAGVVVGALGMLAAMWIYTRIDDARYTLSAAAAAKRAPEGDEPPKATCACGELRSMHANGTGRCQVEKRGHGAAPDGKCACQVYDGPEPMLYVDPRPVADR